MHLISASRRTDLPALYSDWFMRRIRAGEASWINPYSGRVATVSLDPAQVAAIVFWTRNFAPMMNRLEELDRRGYRYLVHYTITGLSRTYESHVPPAGAAVEQLRSLAGRIGPDRVHWRYDPILIGPGAGPDFHRRNFADLAARLAGHTRRCSISFVQVYGKVRRNFLRRDLPLPEIAADRRRALAAELGGMAAAHGITVAACCNDELMGTEVDKARCVDAAEVRRLWPELDFEAAAAPSREQCGCSRSCDIGAYDSCVQGCLYCYATRDRETARARRADHRPDSPTLLPPRRPAGA